MVVLLLFSFQDADSGTDHLLRDEGGATAGAFVGPAHLCFGDRVGRVKERPGFHNGYRQALLRQHLGRHAAAGTGAYDDGIVGFGRFLDFHD